VDDILNAIRTHKIDKASWLICIGSGPVQDCVGFAASIAHRGVRFMRMPTSVLSQGDSGVGVKCAIDFSYEEEPKSFRTLKNWLGTFYVPDAVINDQNLLRALTDREWRFGCSELIKAGVVWNKDVFDYIEANIKAMFERDSKIAKKAIYLAAREYVNHISQAGDPWEKIPTPPFYHAHCIAHLLEKYGNPKVPHGEAVAIGICIDGMYQHMKGHVSLETVNRFTNIFWALKLQVMHPCLVEKKKCIKEAFDDLQELIGGKFAMPMLFEREGKWFLENVYEIDEEVYGAAIDAVYALQQKHEKLQ